MAGTLKVRVIGDTHDLERSLGAGLKSLAKFGAAAIAAGAAAATAIGAKAIAEAREAEKITRLTEAVVKSTGGAAKVSVDQVGALAERLSNVAGADDEVIQGAENLLLTFTKVRNEVGKGNDIFDRGTTAALNMSAALGTDMNGAALQVGKALNDPVKGMTALTRAGVSFTQQQKDQVAAMVAAGDVLGAQKLILGEMETQFGGAAAAAADPMQKLSVVAGNLAEKLGMKLLPLANRVANFLAGRLPGVLDKVLVGFEALGAAFSGEGITSDGFVGGMERVGVALRAVWDWLGKVVRSFRDGSGSVGAWKDAFALLGGPMALIVRELLPKLQPLIAAIVGPLAQIANQVGPPLVALFAQLAMTVLPPLVSVLTAVTSVLEKHPGIIQAIAAVIAAVMIPQWIEAGVKATISAAKQAAAWVATSAAAIAGAVVHTAQIAVMVAKWVWLGVQSLAHAAKVAAAWLISMGPIALVIAAVVGLVTAIVVHWDTIKRVIVGAATAVWDWLKANWPLILAILTGPFGLAVLAIIRHWDSIKGVVTGALGFLRDTIGSILGAISTAWNTAWSGVRDFFGEIWDTIKSRFRGALNFIIGGVNAFIRFWNNLELKIPGINMPGPIPDIPGVTIGLPNLPTIPVLHGGGVFRAPPGQNEGLALLADRERVLPAGASTNIQIHVEGSIWTTRELVDTLQASLAKKRLWLDPAALDELTLTLRSL